MKRFVVGFLEKITKMLKNEEKNVALQSEPEVIDVEILTLQPQTSISETSTQTLEVYVNKLRKTRNKQLSLPTRKTMPKDMEVVFVRDARDVRDITGLMEAPFLSLSKNRTTPILYESPDGKSKIKVSCHTGHYLASIYDWDIVLFIASKMQEIINISSDVPPRTLIIPRHELLRFLHKHDGKKEEKDLKASLSRLKLTGIETTIHNENGKYESGFGFLDSWGYTERKDMKEFKITLSEWLYGVVCQKGALLKVHPEYFKITSGLKRFLYRTARKHVGVQNKNWEFSVEALYKKSGSEREFKKFKHDLKKIVEENDLYGYLLEWVDRDNKAYINFINTRKEIRRMLLI